MQNPLLCCGNTFYAFKSIPATVENFPTVFLQLERGCHDSEFQRCSLLLNSFTQKPIIAKETSMFLHNTLIISDWSTYRQNG